LASARIVEGLGRIGAAKENFAETVMQSVDAVVNAPGGEAGRAREAVRLVGPSIEAIDRSLEEETPEIMAAVAELSHNWEEHEGLWDALGPGDLPVALEAEGSIAELREALVNARESDRTFRESLENFAAIGPEPAAATRGAINRLQGVMAALDEHRNQADESLRTLGAIVLRLEG
jgi:hypothetical protein